ncbi:hypothetical protein MACK_002861 [Theileria orientalis]|uniref:RING-type domain-containing protein n=1 Tax=Theileria orientalis TaxID=68886 RepID=A0A976MFB3_THEOR|nr:hypothetical protein MACK_002861 [Theileria orientalis]
MESRSPSDELDTSKSLRKRHMIKIDSHYTQSQNSQSDDDESRYKQSPNQQSDQSPVFHSPSENHLDPEATNEETHTNPSPYNHFHTASMDIPEFDHELLQSEYMSQNIFDQDDHGSVHSDARDDCEIVNIVQSGSSNNSSITVDALSRFNMLSSQNGSTSDPILVDDSVNSSVEDTNHEHNTNEPSNYNNEVYEVVIATDTSTQNRTNILSQPNFTNTPRRSINTAESREQDSDDCIMGPIHWGNKRPPMFPLDYYRTHRNFSNAYKFLDTERPSELRSLDDIEFLFKCPICYSTITRLRSGKVPNENDKVIYSTKCGHLFCYECIENVRTRKECSICRKPVRDKYQYHVVFP